MHSALWVSKTGMAAQDTKMTAISNNLANVNTVASNAIEWCLKICFIAFSVNRGRKSTK